MTENTEYKREGYRKPFIATDIIIEYGDGNKDGIVLISRKNPPHGIAIPGGFAEYGLSLEENALKEAREETGLEVMLETPEAPLCVHSGPDRDPRGHVISIAYVGKGKGEIRAGDDAKEAALYTIDEVIALLGQGSLVFDHGRILLKYLQYRGHMK